LLPANAAERQLFSIWGGYLVVCVVIGISTRLREGLSTSLEFHLYPAMSCFTALAFFAMGASYWGWCYVFGACFVLLTFAMGLDLRWAPMEFGCTWAALLLVIGYHLRMLGAK
jgi:hypothetical protein